MVIHENRTLGIDLGIASCGWAVIEDDGDGQGHIVAMGSRTWDAPETDKERTPTNQLRRGHRGMRRVLKRRRQRMNEIRRLFREHGLIEVQGPSGLRIAELNPWTLRDEGLDRKLTGHELAVALGHIAKHRGFKSNRKGERGGNAADESSKMLKAIGETRDRLAEYRTVGQMFARDEALRRTQAQSRRRVHALNPTRRSGERGRDPVRRAAAGWQSARDSRTGGSLHQDRLFPTPAPGQRAPHRGLPVREDGEALRPARALFRAVSGSCPASAP